MVDQNILLRRLQTSYGMHGAVLQWYMYLVGRRHDVRTGSTAPKGHGLRPHLYADDIQIYGFCPPSASLQLQNVISTCIDVAAWM